MNYVSWGWVLCGCFRHRTTGTSSRRCRACRGTVYRCTNDWNRRWPPPNAWWTSPAASSCALRALLASWAVLSAKLWPMRRTKMKRKRKRRRMKRKKLHHFPTGTTPDGTCRCGPGVSPTSALRWLRQPTASTAPQDSDLINHCNHISFLFRFLVSEFHQT